MSNSVFDSQEMTKTGWALAGRVPGQSGLARVPIFEGPFCVGRGRHGVQLTLRSTFVSSRHAELQVVTDGIHVRDLDSRNGTYVRGTRIEGTALAGEGDAIAFADVEFRLERHVPAQEDTELDAVTQINLDSFAAGWTLSNFARLLQDDTILPHFQPIVRMADGEFFGLEALARSDVDGLETPASMFEAAEALDQAAQLSLVCRSRAVSAVRGLSGRFRLFLNTHPAECLEGEVLKSLEAAQQVVPGIRLVVEIHEDFVDDTRAIAHFSKRLQAMNIELALDDFGAGRSRLKELVEVRPTFVKFDRKLISNLDQASESERDGIKSLIQFLHSLSILTVAEGIERAEEARVCRDLGFDLAQGFYFARPRELPSLDLDDTGEFQLFQINRAPWIGAAQ